MSAPEKPAPIVPFAVTPKEPVANIVPDDSGRSIMALLQKAGEMAKEDCARHGPGAQAVVSAARRRGAVREA